MQAWPENSKNAGGILDGGNKRVAWHQTYQYLFSQTWENLRKLFQYENVYRFLTQKSRALGKYEVHFYDATSKFDKRLNTREFCTE